MNNGCFCYLIKIKYSFNPTTEIERVDVISDCLTEQNFKSEIYRSTAQM